MAAFTAKDVQALREATSCGMMDCKKALTASEGDFDKAVEFLREKGLAAAQKKAGRIAAEGTVYAIYDEAKKVAVAIEVNAETDFVAKNEMFMNFVKACAATVVEQNPADVDALLNCTLSGSKDTVQSNLNDLVLKIGENMKVRRFVRMEGDVATYIHAGGTIGVLVEFNVADEAAAATEEFKAMGKDVAMQVAAMSPAYLDAASVPADVVAKEKEIELAQMDNDPKNANKPQNIKEKMIEGKMKKFFAEICLVSQTFVKDNKMSVTDYINSVAKTLGTTITVKSFIRMEKGEGLEKRVDDFASEVASMVK